MAENNIVGGERDDRRRGREVGRVPIKLMTSTPSTHTYFGHLRGQDTALENNLSHHCI